MLFVLLDVLLFLLAIFNSILLFVIVEGAGDRLRFGFVILDVHSDGINPPPPEKLLHSVTAAEFRRYSTPEILFDLIQHFRDLTQNGSSSSCSRSNRHSL
ncbi:hypothetical protein L2E82_43786 [Cichorium intybus]|uniref:Uncharacterized protein n=1 Tax=Cichorium intybus TaxID=13427 RepID=A0ACB8ZP62_CICIN|nr:hypothetical protein L2E82_43786 [Cichorium intybus]